MSRLPTIWVLGDQLNARMGALGQCRPGQAQILIVESAAKLAGKRWHVQRAHFVVASMRRFAEELRDAGYDVDYRTAASLPEGLAEHRREFDPASVTAMEPASWDGREMLRRNGVTLTRSDQFLCHPDTFAEWARGRRQLRLEDFYRWQRRRLGYLMDDGEPAGGRWNYDHDNRRPLPKGGGSWPTPVTTALDQVDLDLLAELPSELWGAPPDGVWATSRGDALRRLDHAIDTVLPRFGPHEDAMSSGNWHLAHTLLSPYLNIGLLHPGEVANAAEAAYRRGYVPIASAEGFIRQVIGWREYVWGLYWLWMPDYRTVNAFDAHRPLPPAFTTGVTQMRCVRSTIEGLHAHAWVHHIQRLMILGNLSLLAGVEPWALTEWMWASFVDGAEWVMATNVLGMALHADGGRMATKPYAAGGAYIDRMSDYCKGCRYDRSQRTGPDACPYTTLYWNFLLEHATTLRNNPRMTPQLTTAQRLDEPALRRRAAEVLQLLDDGAL